jgi:excinuclease ABC subunit A
VGEDRHNFLELNGAKENNLKSLNLKLEHNKFIVITGVSGSGKSTLAFDTIYAEGGRRYIETFSPYTRQFLDRLKQPELDSMNGVRPALALEQRNKTTGARSTVGTITEINDYLKVIWANLAIPYCASCDVPIEKHDASFIYNAICQELSKANYQMGIICFPLALTGEASFNAIKETLLAEGLTRVLEPKQFSVLNIETLDPKVLSSKELLVVVDRLKLTEIESLTDSTKKRLTSSVTQAYHLGKHQLKVALINSEQKNSKILSFNEALHCKNCGADFAQPKAGMFSFNSPLGACDTCHGFGKTLDLDIDICVPNKSLSIKDGALACWNTKSTKREFGKLLAFCKVEKIDVTLPWSDLTETQKSLVIDGPPKAKSYKGLRAWFKRLERKKYKMHVRVFLSRYRGEFLCTDCNGTRIKAQARTYRLNNLTLPEIWKTPVADALRFFRNLEHQSLISSQLEVALGEVISRFEYLESVGLDYLTLDRQAKTLSGGEFQRVNLTTILGSRLVNTTLVLDEPTIGLHSRDTNRLIETLKKLRDRGNSVITVEHDLDTIRAADQIIDLGPNSGAAGGEILYQGPLSGLKKIKNSLTAKYLASEINPSANDKKSKPFSLSKNHPCLQLIGCSANNLKNISLKIPLNQFVVISGVSGSGKSSLIEQCLFGYYQKLRQSNFELSAVNPAQNSIKQLKGLEHLDKIELIDQSPVGKTPRSNSATYSGLWEILREMFAETADAQKIGLGKSAFSFNVDGGRCPECKGAGSHKIEMQFLADVFVQCEKCSGLRFQDQVLEVKLFDKNVSELLSMTLEEVKAFLAPHLDPSKLDKIEQLLNPLLDLGLGYLTLGHPLNNLSGGEAQRLKLASYLSKENKEKCLFILDEPTTGLHRYNVFSLLETFKKLLLHGHSIVCVEHNLDVIYGADYLIELGPEGGELGGELLLEGNPRTLYADKKNIKLSHTLKSLADSINFKAESVSTKKSSSKKTTSSEAIKITGARHHNLKDVSLEIPKNKLTVVTGVSGSGKSTLAFDIVFNEGQRRYIDCLSPYARQFIKQLERPELDSVTNLPPTVAVSQKTAPPLGVSTLATTTEVYQFLRLLYSKVGTQHCPEHDLPITATSVESIAEEISNKHQGKRIYFFAPVVSGRKGHYRELFARALRADITEALVDNKVISITSETKLERHKLHWVSLLVASIGKVSANNPLLIDAVKQTLLLGNGVLELVVDDKYNKPTVFSSERVCPKCNRGFRELDPQDFSFRSARGVCTTCSGRGHIELRNESTKVCPDCKGSRIAAIGRNVLIDGHRIHQLTHCNSNELLKKLDSLKINPKLEPIISPIFHELKSRLKIICDIGLDYLSLDREASSISGGEAQRLRLARTLGSPLVGVCYILDEPTIGLHPQDHQQVLNTILDLRDAGNTVVVVEHDEAMIRAADNIIDIGPGGGANGGHLVAHGSISDIIKNKDSVTGKCLAKSVALIPKEASSTKISKDEYLKITGAKINNLKNISASFPLNKFCVVAGVSGSGKSSLVRHSLIPAVIDAFENKKKTKSKTTASWEKLENHESISRLLEIDQTPVGKTSASTPASYLGIFDDIRSIFASLPEAKANGWTKSFFSYNSGKGKCPACQGKGVIKIPMSFLPEASAICEQCDGLRYNEQALEVLFQGYSIGEILGKTLAEAKDIFKNHRNIQRILEYVSDMGVGYLTLGQRTSSLSGGEVQRLKIAKELGSAQAIDTLYILDEPTTGLHMADVDKLINVFRKLIDKGNTVIVIEHDLDVIRNADYLLEMGPGAGDLGGEVIFSGSPAKLAKGQLKTPTYLALNGKKTKSLSPIEKSHSVANQPLSKTAPNEDYETHVN